MGSVRSLGQSIDSKECFFFHNNSSLESLDINILTQEITLSMPLRVHGVLPQLPCSVPGTVYQSHIS